MEAQVELSQYASGLFALIGTIVGALVSFFTQAHLAKSARKAERKAIASALAAEIEAYLEIVDLRQTFSRSDQIVSLLEAGHNIPLKGFGVGKDEDLEATFPVFRATISRIGLLDREAGSVAKFYAIATAVRATAQAGERGELEGMPPTEKASFVREELAVFRVCIQSGAALVKRLRSLR